MTTDTAALIEDVVKNPERLSEDTGGFLCDNPKGIYGYADDYDALRAATEAVLGEQIATLAELAALVRGECPALLDDLRDGCSRLDLEIDDALANARALYERVRT